MQKRPADYLYLYGGVRVVVHCLVLDVLTCDGVQSIAHRVRGISVIPRASALCSKSTVSTQYHCIVGAEHTEQQCSKLTPLCYQPGNSQLARAASNPL